MRWHSATIILSVVLLAAGSAWSQDKPAESPAKPPEFQGQPLYLKVGNGVTPPIATYNPEPNYSKEAKKKHYQGTLILKTIVAPDGKAHDITVARSLGYGLDEEAIKAVKKWRFQPATKDGQPVAMSVAIEVSFHLY